MRPPALNSRLPRCQRWTAILRSMDMPEIQACPDEIRRGLKLLFRHGDVVELRVPKTPRDGTISGYFNGSEALIKCAIELDRRIIPAQYVTLNELDPALLARSANRVKTRADVTTSDGNIRRRRWLLVDLDSRRPAGVSASDVEHQAALDRARTGRDGLAAEGWPMPILADSGNGSHLLYRIDLPNDPTVTQLVTKCLKAISQRYGDAQVSIDETVGNPARITKLYGTPARKGDDTPERPHRLSQILEAPETCAVVPEDLLVKLAAEVTDPVRPAVAGKGSGFQVEDWIARHGLKVRRGPLPWEGRGEKWELEVCPFDEEHTGGCAVITRGHDGRIGFRCQHNSCSGKGWRELRELLDGPHDLRMRWGLSDEDLKHQVARAEVADDWPKPE